MLLLAIVVIFLGEPTTFEETFTGTLDQLDAWLARWYPDAVRVIVKE